MRTEKEKENDNRPPAEIASERIQDAGAMSKAVADEFLRRHPEAVDLVLKQQTNESLRDSLSHFVWSNDPEAQKAYREARIKEGLPIEDDDEDAEPDEPDTETFEG